MAIKHSDKLELDVNNEDNWTGVYVREGRDVISLACGLGFKPGRKHRLSVLKAANRQWDKIGRRLTKAIEREEAKLSKPAK